MKLFQVSDKVWYAEYEAERDRPNLGYIRGDRWSIAVDAGHSGSHVEEFYQALDRAGLPLPSLTVLTHWHWDHTFGMHRIHGLSVASQKTADYLDAIRKKLDAEGLAFFFALDPSIRLEYADHKPVIVVPPDILFENALYLDAGNTPVRIFRAESPHTDDAVLVFLPEERILFYGDARSGVFPTWEANPAKVQLFIHAVEETGAEICIGGHWEAQKTEDLIRELCAEI